MYFCYLCKSSEIGKNKTPFGDTRNAERKNQNGVLRNSFAVLIFLKERFAKRYKSSAVRKGEMSVYNAKRVFRFFGILSYFDGNVISAAVWRIIFLFLFLRQRQRLLSVSLIKDSSPFRLFPELLEPRRKLLLSDLHTGLRLPALDL